MKTCYPLLALLCLPGAQAASVSITSANIDSAWKNSGKNAFIKFQAPW
jgi:hypothetical protein